MDAVVNVAAKEIHPAKDVVQMDKTATRAPAVEEVERFVKDPTAGRVHAVTAMV